MKNQPGEIVRDNVALCITVLALAMPSIGATAPLALSREPFALTSSGSPASASSRVSSLAVSEASTRGESSLFLAAHQPIQWTGMVTGFIVGTGSTASFKGLWGTVSASGATVARPVSTATLLDSLGFIPTNRVVLSAVAGSAAGAASTGISWTWNSLAADQRNALNTVDGRVDALGNQRLAYLRGDRSRETANGGTFRNRASRQGDIVNSKLWHLAAVPNSGYHANDYSAFKKRTSPRDPMLYVGANDGMLHGFSAATGTEKIAYVPRGVYARLPSLTNSPYAHRYFVDGSPFTADIHVDGSWKTWLAGFTGLGGTGYFVLDVTDPAAFSAIDASRLVVLDQTGSTDVDIGHITSEPVREHDNTALTRQISQLNDKRWALITGNGYNSASEAAVLLIQYLDGARELKKIVAVNATSSGLQSGNGLSAPRLIDLNGDKIPDIAYAGDLLGNMWKFDLSSNDAKAWETAFDGMPLYVAESTSAPRKPQSITSAPVWMAHPQGGVMVVFGTGRNLTDADRTDTSTQTIYGVYDGTVVTRHAGKLKLTPGSGAIAAGREALVRQDIGPAPTAAGDAGALWTVSSRPVTYTGASSSKGWYLDLPAGERVLGNPEWFEGLLVDIPSIVPATGTTWLTTLNAINGNAPKSQIYAYVSADATGIANPVGTASRIETGLRTAVSNPSNRSEKGLCASGTTCADRILLPGMALRPSWRQLQ
jgi:type IV pilus assembly protein PilY1